MSAFYCPVPESPHGGALTDAPYIFGSFSNFSCADGFQLVGQARRQCVLSDDNAVKWNGETPVCLGRMTATRNDEDDDKQGR